MGSVEQEEIFVVFARRFAGDQRGAGDYQGGASTGG